MKRFIVVALLLVVCASSASAADNPVVFAHRENVNLLDTWDPSVKLTGSNTSTSAILPAIRRQFKMWSDANTYYIPGSGPGVVGVEWLGVEFGVQSGDDVRLRNVKTIDVWHNTSQGMAEGFDVWVNTGSGYYQLPAGSYDYAIFDGTCGANGAVIVGGQNVIRVQLKDEFFAGGLDICGLKLYPTSFNVIEGATNTANRWFVQGLRVYGAPGQLRLNDIVNSDGKGVIDLLANGAYESPITFRLTGSANAGDAAKNTKFASFLDDRGTPVQYNSQVMFSAIGDGFEIELPGNQLYEFSMLRMAHYNQNMDVKFTLSILDENGAWVALPDWTNVPITAAAPKDGASNTNFADFDMGGVVGQGIKLSLTGASTFYVRDLQLFGTPVPEPMTMGLLALGGLAMLRRRK